jgi:hypothetical protein
MNVLNCNVDKKHLLDMLALLLWGEKTSHELSPFYVKFGKRLYKEILADLKNQIAYRQNISLNNYDFCALNMKCQDLSDLYFLEKRLELIEQKLAESR